MAFYLLVHRGLTFAGLNGLELWLFHRLSIFVVEWNPDPPFRLGTIPFNHLVG